MKRGVLTAEKIKEAYDYTGYTLIDGAYLTVGTNYDKRCACPMTTVAAYLADCDVFNENRNTPINHLIKNELEMDDEEQRSFWRGFDGTVTQKDINQNLFDKGKKLRKVFIENGLLEDVTQ